MTLAAQPAGSDEPRYTSDGHLVRPENYREWVFLSSGLGMTYGLAEKVPDPAQQRFDNVFVTPKAYKAFLQTGAWPDKTMFALEVRNSATKGSINKGGHYQEGVAALEIHLKDQKRFAGKWAFFGFGPTDQNGKPFPANSACQTCHAKSGAVDETFVQFYPTLLPVAKAKGTLKPEAEQ
jgi:Cytochrome P460